MYGGQFYNVPVGEMGLYTDDSQTIMPPQGLLRAENIELRNGFLEKQPGSRRWNKNPLPAAISAFIDWWPDENTQREIVVTVDGRVWRFYDAYNFSEVLPVSGAPTLLRVTHPVCIVSGGQEASGNPRKLFIFTGNDPVQVIEADGTTRRNMRTPALDWTLSLQPTFGIVFQNRLWAFGNRNQPHFLYGSNVEDQEDFQTLAAAIFVPVFPGDSERIMSACNYKGRFTVFKYPFGYYFIDTTDPTAPIPQKLGDSFGAASQTSIVQPLDDLWVGNSSGSITSLQATLNLGGLQQGDVIKNTKFFNYILENVAPLKDLGQFAIWYEAKKMAMFTYHSPSGTDPNRILIIDFQSGRPRAVFTTKDQPNCLGLVKDITRVQRPFYGANDGYLYAMDDSNRNVGGNAYSMTFQVPYLDFGFVDRHLAERNKNFDFLEITFEPTGNWSLFGDVYIDNKFIETVEFNVDQENVMDLDFNLDVARVSGPGPRSIRRPIHGMGRRISVRFYASGLNQNIKVSGVTYYFRPSGQQQRSA